VLAEARLEGINESVVAQCPHAAREEDPADDQAEAEEEAALSSGCDVGLEGALGSSEKVAAVDPGGGHGEQGDPLRQGTPRDDEVGRGAVLHLACGQEADRQKGRQDEQEDGERQAWILSRSGGGLWGILPVIVENLSSLAATDPRPNAPSRRDFCSNSCLEQ
jgi:hypothetical protein